jgi:hypothetical protein
LRIFREGWRGVIWRSEGGRERGCWRRPTTLSTGWKAVDPATDPVYRGNSGRTHQMLRGAVKCDQAGETLIVRWNGTTLGLSAIPQGDGMELEVTIDQQPPITLKRSQTEKQQPYSRFFYLPELAPGEHTAVIKIKRLPEGVSYYAGQLLVVGEFVRK